MIRPLIDKVLATLVGSAALLPLSVHAEQLLFVENSASGDLTVISVEQHKVVGMIRDLPHPDDVVASADGRTIFVNLLIDRLGHGLKEATAGEIVALDSRSHTVKWRLPIPEGAPNHMAVSSSGLLYVPLFDRPYALIIDTNKPAIVGRLDALFGMHSVQLSKDETRLYAGSMLTASLYVFDLTKNELEKIIDFKDGVRPIQVTADGTRLYAQRSRYHGFDVVDLSAGKVVKSIDLPALPPDFVYPTRWPHNVNHGLGLSPDQKFLLAAATVAGYVAVYAHPDLGFVKTIPVGREPNWITFTADSTFAYVGCRGSNEVSVIDLSSLDEIARIPTGGKGSARLKVVDVPDGRDDLTPTRSAKGAGAGKP